jgi:hypothetical protein
MGSKFNPGEWLNDPPHLDRAEIQICGKYPALSEIDELLRLFYQI